MEKNSGKLPLFQFYFHRFWRFVKSRQLLNNIFIHRSVGMPLKNGCKYLLWQNLLITLVFFLAIDYFILLVFNNIGEVHVRCHWNDKTRQRSIERMKDSLLDTFIVQHKNLNCGLFTLLLCREQRENLH